MYVYNVANAGFTHETPFENPKYLFLKRRIIRINLAICWLYDMESLIIRIRIVQTAFTIAVLRIHCAKQWSRFWEVSTYVW